MQFVKPKEVKIHTTLEHIPQATWEDFYPGDIIWFNGKPKWRKKADDTWEDLQTN